MHILMLTRDMDLGGISACITEYSDVMTEKGHQVYVCALDGVAVRMLRPKVTFIPVDFRPKDPVAVLRILGRLYRLVKREQIDVIHCHRRRMTLYARALHLLTGVDCIWQEHGVIQNYNNGRLHRMLAYPGKQVIAISQERFAFLTEKMGIPEDKITRVGHGLRPERYQRRSEEECRALREKYGVMPGEKTILLLGRLSREKGHGFLLDAVKELPGDYKLLFTGEGMPEYRRELEEQIERLGLTDRVILTGNVDPSDILSISDVMVLPSTNEGFGLVAIEAMALRVPVIRTRTGGYEEMQDCVDGVDYGDTATLTALIKKNLERGPDIQQRVDYAYEKLLERWDLNVIVDRLLEVYAM